MKRLELTFFVYCFRELIFFRKIFDYHISQDYSTWQDNKRKDNIKISFTFHIGVVSFTQPALINRVSMQKG